MRNKSLQKPEQTILNIFRNELKEMKMLDIGVGDGRTTLHFANLTKEYIGIDYSEQMIKECKKEFKNKKNIHIKIMDARNLKTLKENYFDLVLFSFNGIDYMNHKDRIKTFQEIKRVLKNNGNFIFSTHNLNSLDNLYNIKYTKNSIQLIRRTLKHFILTLLNGSIKKIRNKETTYIRDGAHKFKLKNYYITPTFQIQQLEKLGFENIKLFSLSNGQLIDNSNLKEIEDSWIYYVCKIKKDLPRLRQNTK